MQDELRKKDDRVNEAKDKQLKMVAALQPVILQLQGLCAARVLAIHVSLRAATLSDLQKQVDKHQEDYGKESKLEKGALIRQALKVTIAHSSQRIWTRSPKSLRALTSSRRNATSCESRMKRCGCRTCAANHQEFALECLRRFRKSRSGFRVLSRSQPACCKSTSRSTTRPALKFSGTRCFAVRVR